MKSLKKTYKSDKPLSTSHYTELFCRTFGDSYEFAEKMLSVCDRIFEIYENGEICSGLCTFNVKIKSCGTYYKGAYIFGAATAEKYRNCGYFKKICREVYGFYKNKKYDFIMTVPASEELFSLYEHMGYNTIANGVISLCSEKTDIIVPDGCEFSDFDGNFEKLYSLHIQNDVLQKELGFFTESVSGFEIKYIRYKKNTGYALYDDRKLVFASCVGLEYKSKKKACFCFLDKNFHLPENLLCDMLFEI